MHFVASLAVAVAASVVSASPVSQPITLPVTHVHNVKSVKTLVERGEARLKYINAGETHALAEDISSGPVTNEDVSYVANVTVGGVSWQLIVDTGSSNLWCGVHKRCEKTSTGKPTGRKFHVSYGSGAVTGKEFTDAVSFAGLTVRAQSLGAATKSQGFGAGVDGILGLGPVDLTQNTVGQTKTVPTFMDNLYKQGSIPSEVLGVYFQAEPGSSTNSANGELTLGGTDSSKYNGSISYVPTLKTGDASHYWGVGITGFTYGSKTLSSTTAAAIVDTGTTLIYISVPAYKAFVAATGGKVDQNSGLLSFTTAPTGNFGIKIGSLTLTLTPAQYLVPQAQYKYFGLTAGKSYAWFTEGSTSGVECIIGQKFLENYYSVFDTTNSQIGFAPAI